jgi:hypothetical protein
MSTARIARSARGGRQELPLPGVVASFSSSPGHGKRLLLKRFERRLQRRDRPPRSDENCRFGAWFSALVAGIDFFASRATHDARKTGNDLTSIYTVLPREAL